MSKKALGKGIGALFTETSHTKANNTNNSDDSLKKVPIKKLTPNPYQPRKEFREESLQELADSIKQNGIIQPILAEEQEDGTYIIIAGERRARAAKLADLVEVPVILDKFTIEEKIEIALIENIQREDLSPIEEAMGYKTLMDTLELNQEEVAKKVGKSRSAVANSLRLLKLPEKIKESLNHGVISAGHARAILSVINPADQEFLFNRIIEQNLSVREAEQLSSELNKGNKLNMKEKNKPSNEVTNPEMHGIKQKFIDTFGTKVEIRGSFKKGKIEISYFSMDDLERILEIIK